MQRNTALKLTLQYVSQAPNLPSEADFATWAAAALPADANTELVIRVVNEAESRQLNATYRAKNSPTNVLSFPFETPPGIPTNYLGDLVICAPVVERESTQQNKQRLAHWAHMVVHGVLHLCGYDHQHDAEANKMENKERAIMHALNFSDPYQEPLIESGISVAHRYTGETNHTT